MSLRIYHCWLYCSGAWTCLPRYCCNKVGVLLAHRSSFRRLPFLPPPITDVGTSGIWTQLGYLYSWLKALAMKLSKPSGRSGSYTGLIGFSPRWLMLKRGWAPTQRTTVSMWNLLLLLLFLLGYWHQRADERHGNPPQGKRATSGQTKLDNTRWAWVKQVHGMWYFFPSVLWHCWLVDRKDIGPVKNWMLVCWCWWFDWSFARLVAPVVQLWPTRPSSFASINTG